MPGEVERGGVGIQDSGGKGWGACSWHLVSRRFDAAFSAAAPWLAQPGLGERVGRKEEMTGAG